MEELRERLQAINQTATDHPEEPVDGLQQIIIKAKEEGESNIVAEGNYYLAEIYFKLGNMKKVLEHAYSGLAFARKNVNSKTFLPKLYNIAGVANATRGEYVMAQELYSEGLSLAQTYKDTHTKLSIKNNIGSMFCQLGDYDEGWKYVRKVYEAAVTMLDTMSHKKITNENYRKIENVKELLYISIFNMAGIYYHRQEYEQALNFLKQIDEYELVGKGYIYSLNIAALEVKVFFAIGADRRAVSSLNSLLTHSMLNAEKTDIFEEFIEIVHILMEKEMYEETEQCFPTLRHFCNKFDAEAMWMQYYDVLARYNKAIGDTEAYQKICEKYYTYGVKNAGASRKSMLWGIKTQMELAKSMEIQRRESERAEELKLLSETDELTTLLNRRSFNNLSQRYYQTACKTQKPFGLIILDIDHFKEYNDRYGHVLGDECLKTVSNVLKEHDGNGFVSSRYGGDEFVVMAQNRSDAKIVEYIESVIKEIADRNISYSHSPTAVKITVSIGAANMVPSEDRTVTDLLHLADEALYRTKKAGKNGYTVHEEKSEKE